MLEWEIKTGDEKLRNEIKRCKDGFDGWFNSCWAKRCSKEKMLSENSPVPHVYYKVCKPFQEVKENFPYAALEKCSSCGNYVDKWIETSFSFCDEYGCGMSLCTQCANKLKNVIEKL